MDHLTKLIETLIEKASKADKSEDALRFSQAATNSANALCALGNQKYVTTEKTTTVT
jgi:hypothetical protein